VCPNRPTWAPAQGRETRVNTQQYSSRDLASHTKLKFRQPGQGNTSDISRRDLRLELMRAEAKANGKEEDKGEDKGEDEQVAKRRRLIEEAKDLDKDDSDAEEGPSKKDAAVKEKAAATGEGDTDMEEEDSEEEDSDDDEDDTQALLRELEKIKRERALEKERQVSASCISSVDSGRRIVSRPLSTGSHAHPSFAMP
jgi:protein CWC15